jgi:hypothetical protein
MAAALLVNAPFMVVEVAVGVIAHSLALLSGAAHMLTDAGAIGLALFAAPAGAPAPEGQEDLWVRTHRNSLRTGQRADARDPRRIHRLRGHSPAGPPATGRS